MSAQPVSQAHLFSGAIEPVALCSFLAAVVLGSFLQIKLPSHFFEGGF